MNTFLKSLTVTAALGLLATGAHAEGTGYGDAQGSTTGAYSSDPQADNPGVDNGNGMGARADINAAQEMDTQARMDRERVDARMGADAQTQADANARMGANQQQAGADIAENALDSAAVRNIQQSLREEGYNIAVDGIWGNNTVSALRNFQQENNLDATGELDTGTLAALDVQLENQNQGAAGAGNFNN